MKKTLINISGQALVTLLFISVIGITIATAAAIIIFQNIKSSSVVEQGMTAYFIAESGVEEAILRTLRNPSYSGTPTGIPISIDGGSLVISTSSGGIITAVGTFNNAVRKIQVKTVYNNGVLSIVSWKEIK